MRNRQILLSAAIAATCGFAATAQSAIDAYTLSGMETRGSARFMAMGGAFTALGGDLSVFTQNPGGIGIYRSSEIGATIDLDFRHYTDKTPGLSFKDNQTKFWCNNFGYVGTVKLDGAMKTFSWGASYSRLKSFDNLTKGYNRPTQTSLSNYIAGFTDGVKPSDMSRDKDYNPYFDSDIDWLSILGYQSGMIKPAGNGKYTGLFQKGTEGDAEYYVHESGYADEYNFSFGGNVSDMVYWGLTIGVTDLEYRRETYYSESMADAFIRTKNGTQTTGNAGFDLYNRKHITGTGWNLKGGVIIKPVNEFRIGLAVHTPTWYSMSEAYNAQVEFSYLDLSAPDSENNPYQGDPSTEWADFDWRMRTPWRLMAGVAGVIGSTAIVSLDYEYQAYNDMKVWRQSDWALNDYVADTYVNTDIKDYFQGSNIIRLGVN